MNADINEVLKRMRMVNDGDGYFSPEIFAINRLFGLKDLLEYVKCDKTWIVAEVGSFAGASAELISIYAKEVHCIDPFEVYFVGSNPPEYIHPVHQMFRDTMARNDNIVEHIKYSIEGSKDFEDGFFDMVYIDANHDYPHPKEDIIHWMPKIKKGGWLCGHDFTMEDVRKSIAEVFPNPELSIEVFSDSSFAIIL